MPFLDGADNSGTAGGSPAAGATVYTAAVDCFFREQVVWYAQASDANVFDSITHQVSWDGTNWNDSAAGVGTSSLGDFSLAPMNGAGFSLISVLCAVSNARFIPWKYCRLKLVANATPPTGVVLRAYRFSGGIPSSTTSTI